MNPNLRINVLNGKVDKGTKPRRNYCRLIDTSVNSAKCANRLSHSTELRIFHSNKSQRTSKDCPPHPMSGSGRSCCKVIHLLIELPFPGRPNDMPGHLGRVSD